MKHSAEEPLPYHVMMEIEDLLASLPAQLAALFGSRPWPRLEMLAMARLVASETGVPDLCDDVFCRRSGMCWAETIGDNGPPCAEFWSDDALTRLQGSFEGLALAWMLTEHTAAAARERLATQMVETATPAGRRKSRPSRRARKR